MEPESQEAVVVDWSDFARMRAQLGGDFIRILGYFREDGEKSIARIEAAMRSGDAAAFVIPAHTLKSEARQFGAHSLGDLAETIELAGRRALESRLFPDEILPDVAALRPLYQEVMDLLEAETNPLCVRRSAASQAGNSEFGRI